MSSREAIEQHMLEMQMVLDRERQRAEQEVAETSRLQAQKEEKVVAIKGLARNVATWAAANKVPYAFRISSDSRPVRAYDHWSIIENSGSITRHSGWVIATRIGMSSPRMS